MCFLDFLSRNFIFNHVIFKINDSVSSEYIYLPKPGFSWTHNIKVLRTKAEEQILGSRWAHMEYMLHMASLKHNFNQSSLLSFSPTLHLSTPSHPTDNIIKFQNFPHYTIFREQMVSVFQFQFLIQIH